MIPYGRQDIDQDDIDAVVQVLRSDWLTQGPAIPAFEAALAATVGARHAVACSSATAALHLACRALGLGPGKRLWTSPITFVASANAALYCGAEVDFVDIEADTVNLSVAALESKLEQAERAGRLPDVVMPVHFAGLPCDLPGIARLRARYGFRVLEDASHAVGATCEGQPVGDCRYSDCAVFSFHPVKIVTTGEGGAVVSQDAGIADAVRLLRTHGITRDPALMVREPDGPWYYEQTDLGFNYRMTDIQAALGTSQLGRLPEFIARRVALVDRYDELLRDLPLRLPARAANARSAWHLYVVQVEDGIDRAGLAQHLRERGVAVNVHYIPVHTQPYYQALGFRRGDFPVAEDYYARALTLPLYPRLTEQQQDQVVDALRTGIERFAGVRSAAR